MLAKELTTGASITSGGKAPLPESKSKQTQNSEFWMVLHEYTPSWTAEEARGVQPVCLDGCDLQRHNYSLTPAQIDFSAGPSWYKPPDFPAYASSNS